MRSGSISLDKRLRIYERDGFKCVDCGFTTTRERVLELIELARLNNGKVKGLLPTEYLTIDHVWPLSRGGSNLDHNLQTLCMDCNQRKASDTPYLTSNKKKKYLKVRHPEIRLRDGRLVKRKTGSASLGLIKEAFNTHHLKDCDPQSGCVMGCPIGTCLELGRR